MARTPFQVSKGVFDEKQELLPSALFQLIVTFLVVEIVVKVVRHVIAVCIINFDLRNVLLVSYLRDRTRKNHVM